MAAEKNQKNYTNDNPVLIPRASELYGKAESHIQGSTGFLTPGEQYILSRIFKSPENGGLMFLWGGCFGAERKMAFFLPKYYFPASLSVEGKNGIVPYVLDSAADFLDEKINALKIAGSGYRELGHRDYLGSILSLGIERDVVGDICVVSPYEAVIFVSSAIVPYILNTLDKIGGDVISSIENIVKVDRNFDTGRKFAEVTVSAASARLDCIVRALSGKGSRDDAIGLIERGFVEINYSSEYKIEKHVSAGDVISIRGIGKFIIDSTDGETKRGRIRITARKYV